VDGELHVIQQKTGAELYLPIVPELEQAMKAYPAKGLSLIGNEYGSLYPRGRVADDESGDQEAGLPTKCVSHGLRKAAMRRLARRQTRNNSGSIRS